MGYTVSVSRLLFDTKKLRLVYGVICAVLFGIVMILSVPIFIFRFVLSNLVKYLRPDLDEIMNGSSSLFVNDLFSGKAPRSTIVVTIIVRGRITLEELKDLVTKNWLHAKDKKTGELIFKRFQQFPVRWLGFTFYKNAFDTFKLENHVKGHDSFGQEYVSEEVLNDFVEKLLNSPYKPEISPWEMHLVNNYRNPQLLPAAEELSVLLFKVHHSLADGYSVLYALVEGFCEHSLEDLEMPVPRFPRRSWWEQLKHILTFPFCFFSELSYALSNELRQSPFKIPDEKKSWFQVCPKSQLIPVQRIKEIKNSLGVSFTSVLLSAISAGIHRSFEDKKVLGKLEGFEDDGSIFSLSALPVPGHNKRLTNHMTGAFFDLPTTAFPTPIERVRACEEVLEKTKQAVMPHLARFYGVALGSHFYWIGPQLFKNKLVPTGLTNFPSVPIHIEKNGKPGISVDFVSGGNEGVAGVGIMVLSYNQQIRIAVTAERAVLSKVEANNFINYITEEINQLYLTCRNQHSREGEQ